MTEPIALPRVRGVVLDLDGTLVDTIDDVAAALTGALEAVGLPAVGAADVAPAMGHGSVDLVRSVLRGLDPGRAEDDEAIAAIHDDYRARYAARPAELSTVFADGASALPALRRAGVRVGVCTNKSTDLANAVLTSVGLDDAVEVVLGRDSVPHPKPDPRHLLEVLDRLDLAPEDTVYVGDNPVDVAVGQGAGVTYRHVAWGEPVDPAVPRLARFGDLVPDADPAASPTDTRSKEN
ncbi:Phosphoglycolate phosphatase [Actinomycetales bacterium JB111]|nr:Phosphoglycolate phosphatase [Actinomycetales bacterium JB111]